MATDVELLLLKRAQVSAQRKKVEAIKSFGLPFYTPWDKQDKFHRAFNYVGRMFRAGNRSGKSLCGCAEDCAWLTGSRPWYKKDDPARLGGIPQRPVKGLIITSDWDIVDSVWTSDRGAEKGKLWHNLPKQDIAYTRRNHSGVISDIGLKNGSLLRFDTVKSWLTNPFGSESADYDFIHVDEPCPKAMFVANARGLMDRQGKYWFTLTPLAEVWINDLFFPEVPSDEVWSIAATTYENPYLSPQALVEYERLLTEDEKSCRLLGIPLHLAGLVYKEFNKEVHVLPDSAFAQLKWPSPVQPPPDWPVYFYIDPHPRTPSCVLFLTVDPHGRKYVFTDLYTTGTIKDIAEEIKNVLRGLYVVRGRIDPFAFINDPITGSNMAEDFAKHGVFVEEAVKDPSRGILAVKQALTNSTLFFSQYARRSLWEIQRFCWDQKPARLNKPVDVDDHAMECLYRAILDDPRWIDRATFGGPAVKDIEITAPQFDLEELIFENSI